MDIKLPKLGEGSDSGTVVGILVKVGDTVQEGQTVLELENEKAIAPIPAPAAGVVTQIHVKEGQKISVGQKLMSLGGPGAAPAKAAPAAPEAKPAAKAAVPAKAAASAPVPVPVVLSAPEPEAAEEPAPSASETPAASPSIRKMARELGIDLARIKGSERGGRIVITSLRPELQKVFTIAKIEKLFEFYDDEEPGLNSFGVYTG